MDLTGSELEKDLHRFLELFFGEEIEGVQVPNVLQLLGLFILRVISKVLKRISSDRNPLPETNLQMFMHFDFY